MKKTKQIQMVKYSLVFSLICSIAFMSSCSKLFGNDDIDDLGKEFDGLYEGEAYADGDKIGEWNFTITDQSVSGMFTAMGVNNSTIYGTVNSEGELSLVIPDINASADAVINSTGDVDGTWKDDEGETGTINGKRVSAGTGNTNGCNHELVGKWVTSSGNIDITFSCTSSEKTGVLHYKDVNNTPGCADGSVTNFKWSTNNKTLSLDYQSMYNCGEKRDTPANDAPQSYSVNGKTLKWAGASWTKQ